MPHYSAFRALLKLKGVDVDVSSAHAVDLDFSALTGAIFTRWELKDNDEGWLYTADGDAVRMYHQQDCCESVWLEDIIGDLDDILHSPITMAEAVDGTNKLKPVDGNNDSYTWTFYKLGTSKGSVTFRWYGSSNGYYSEEVDVQLMPVDPKLYRS